MFANGLTGEWADKNGIRYRREDLNDNRAAETWNAISGDKGAVYAAAAAGPDNLFAKFPDWILPEIGEGWTILDAGCGYGRIAIPILEKIRDTRIVGVDASETMLGLFAEEAAKRNIADRVVLARENLLPLPMEDSSVDCVISTAVLIHNPYEDARRMIDEFHRVLKPGGKIIIIGSFFNLLTVDGLQCRLYVALKPRANGPVHPYTKWGCLKLFRKFDDVTLRSPELALLPRRFGFWHLPGQGFIRRVNERTRRWNLKPWTKSGLFVLHFDVVAFKPADS